MITNMVIKNKSRLAVLREFIVQLSLFMLFIHEIIKTP